MKNHENRPVIVVQIGGNNLSLDEQVQLNKNAREFLTAQGLVEGDFVIQVLVTQAE
eukprot:CAMPEP_0201548332 /NCGR_PEP_ID=MMETSP0173_2-20130828/4862_1 /ASSEMBLY_ACC=CAM_ASM_000268 /TAXON_ID=218659 /ORGANISM="Vexillifera sp., Strain DIVA3 564/2" /LENGTH=55 /DNA_ID=CAMNT_0047957675 /DNA_START=84 /DNA_END=254 /DNA_ORIENTATION=-